MARKRYVNTIGKYLRRRQSGRPTGPAPRRPVGALVKLFRRALFQRQRRKTHREARAWNVHRRSTAIRRYHFDRRVRRSNAIRRSRRRRRR